MFGRKIEISENSTIGGESLGPTVPKSTMILNPDGPFIPSDGVVTSEPLGTMTSRCLGTGATAVLVANAAARSAAVVTSRRSHRSLIRSQLGLDPSLDARLERLGIGVRDSDLAGRGSFVDVPLR